MRVAPSRRITWLALVFLQSPLHLPGCPWECRVTYPRNVRGLPPRLQSPGCVGVVPLSFLAVLSYPRNVRGLPPRLQSPGCVGVVPLSFLAVLPYPILATSGDCLLGCRALDV
ncbi:unnamed protein product [Nezara viridula]|uniref:Neuropeptide n=1 Tax=Nezara viridula TaxID=85310 RepID=A0A9P0H611_NEZVI|nr:unnamed protein product [Nezara viridula]